VVDAGSKSILIVLKRGSLILTTNNTYDESVYWIVLLRLELALIYLSNSFTTTIHYVPKESLVNVRQEK
jgi:hypothetical protein